MHIIPSTACARAKRLASATAVATRLPIRPDDPKMVISSLSSANTIKRNMDKQLQTGVRLFNTREFFECHEVLEAVWTLERGPSRLFLQSLIHIAVGFYHCQRGNPAGASRQLRKGLRKLSSFLPSCEGIDTADLFQQVIAAAEQIEAGAVVGRYPQIQMHP